MGDKILTPEIEDQLDQWVAAKKAKDFETADSIRAALRAQGVEPKEARPGEREMLAQLLAKSGVEPQREKKMQYDSWTEEQLDRWEQAKKDKDLDLADRIRTELRGYGVEPNKARPPAKAPLELPEGMGGYPGQAFDFEIEEQLLNWLEAKREKNYVEADSLRTMLRMQGVEPEKVRPPAQYLWGSGWAEPEWAEWKQSQGAELAPPGAQAPPGPSWTPAPPPAALTPNAAPPTNEPIPTFDRITEAKLDRWVQAMSEQDWISADALRFDLQAKGLVPELLRPQVCDFSMESCNNALGNNALTVGSNTAAPEPVPIVLAEPFFEPNAIDQWRQPQASTDDPATESNAPLDPVSEAKLDKWLAAKREKDYNLADSLRAELLAQGVEAEKLRPPGYRPRRLEEGEQPSRPIPKQDPVTEDKLDRWILAKRLKDFKKADSLRSELRAQGIEPDLWRPPGYTPDPPDEIPVYDEYTEAQLDDWVKMKRWRKYEKADIIRDELRNRGINPDICRPHARLIGTEDEVEEEPLPPLPENLGAWAHESGSGPEGNPVAAVTFPRTSNEARDAISEHYDPDKQESMFADSNSGGSWSSGGKGRSKGKGKGKRENDNDGDGIWYGSSSRPSAAPKVTPPNASKMRGNGEIERLLDDWVAAKRDKDFVRADAIRGDLRTKGIEPGEMRPTNKPQNNKRQRREEPQQWM